MHILLITNTYPTPQQPTRGTFNECLAVALAKEHLVSVIAPAPWHAPPAGFIDRRTSKRAEPPQATEALCSFHPRFCYPPKLLRAHHDRFLWWSIRSTLRQVELRGRPDILLGYWAFPDGQVAVQVARQWGVPAVIISGGSDVLLWTRRRAARKRVLRVLSASDGIVVVSQHLQRELIRLGIRADKILVNRRGIDQQLFAPGDRNQARRRLGLTTDGTMFLWVGRMVPAKGLDVLVQAAALLRARTRSFQIALVGSGPLERRIQQLVRQHQLEAHFRFVGTQLPQQLPDWYRAADATVMPSRSEGVPNVLLESIACGTRVVATDVGGIAEVVDARWDYLVPPESGVALADAMQRCCQSPQRSCAPRRFQPHSWSEAAGELSQWLEELRVATRRSLPGATGGERDSYSTPKTFPASGQCLNELPHWPLATDHQQSRSPSRLAASGTRNFGSSESIQ